MQQYIEILLCCNIFCHNMADLGYRFIVWHTLLLYIANDKLNAKINKAEIVFL